MKRRETIIFQIAAALVIYNIPVFAQDYPNVPGNGRPRFHLTGPGEEYHGPDAGLERTVVGTCQGKTLKIRWSEHPRRGRPPQELVRIKEITFDGRPLDTGSLDKFARLFIPGMSGDFFIGCRWTENQEHDFIVNYSASVFYQFTDYWACTLGGPRPRLSFEWYFYVSEERGIFESYVWPSGRLGDNIPSTRGPTVPPPSPEEFPDCEAYERTGFPLTLED